MEAPTQVQEGELDAKTSIVKNCGESDLIGDGQEIV